MPILESRAGMVEGNTATSVKPPAKASLAPDCKVSLCSLPGSQKSARISNKPGNNRSPFALSCFKPFISKSIAFFAETVICSITPPLTKISQILP